MNAIEHYLDLIESEGKIEFIKWFSEHKIQISGCDTCQHTLYMPHSHASEMKIIKDFILNLVNQLDD